MMFCNSCHQKIPWTDRRDQDDDDNQYHAVCGEKLRTKWDEERQEKMAEEAEDHQRSQEAD
jgi:NAD-dependent SIR2 family protein deacetylase